MEGTSQNLPHTIKSVGLLGSHAFGGKPRFRVVAEELGRELVSRNIKLICGGGSVGLQGTVASTVATDKGHVRCIICWRLAMRPVYGPTYGIERTVPNTYHKYLEMNISMEAFIMLPGGVETMTRLFTLISWVSEGLYCKHVGILNVDGYFNNFLKYLDDVVRQNFMASSQRKLFISSPFIGELLDKLEFGKAFLGLGANYEESANPKGLDLELNM